MEEPRVITELVDGEELFHSTGFTRLKMTDEGKETSMLFPIQSIGIVDLQDELRKSMPRPPKKREFIKKNTPEAKSAGLAHDQWITVLDLADEEYQIKMEQWNLENQWRTVIHALRVTFKDKSGNEIRDYETKVEALKRKGITIFHLMKIFQDIMNLTRDAEGEADFLSVTDLA